MPPARIAAHHPARDRCGSAGFRMIVKLNQELRPCSRWRMKRSSPANSRPKQRGVGPPRVEHRVELLQLLDADRAAHLERPHVVARHDEPVRLEEVVADRPCVDRRFGRRAVPRPAVIADGAREMGDLGWFVTSSPPSIVEMWWE